MNIIEYKSPEILFIKGVFIKDCIPIDDIFEKHIIEQLNAETPLIIYEKLPLIFNSISTWVQITNIKCWYCDLHFDNMPVFIPTIISHDFDSKLYNINTSGCFCSFCCAMSYNNIHNNNICTNIKVKDMLLYLYKVFNNSIIKDIVNSPCKYTMIQYGGDVDPHTYRNKIKKIKELMKLNSVSIKNP